MGSIKISVHPLFFLFGVYYALTGRIFLFLMATITAVAHEIGHSISALNYGYRLNKIVLMPFGAVIKGETGNLRFFDQVKVAISGPLVNLSIGVFLVALWWSFPLTYAYTDTIAYVNFSMALINFIPAYPLDGGRILFSLVAEKKNSIVASKVCKSISIILSIGLFTLFIISIFFTINLSLLFFSLFILLGALNKNEDVRYVKIFSSMSEKRLMQGVKVKRHAISLNATVKALMNILDEQAVNEVVVMDGERSLCIITQENINRIIENGEIYSKISQNLKFLNKNT
jgi:stage IV sporulation protein FB